jgi:hypothetical protein
LFFAYYIASSSFFCFDFLSFLFGCDTNSAAGRVQQPFPTFRLFWQAAQMPKNQREFVLLSKGNFHFSVIYFKMKICRLAKHKRCIQKTGLNPYRYV